MKCTYVFGLLAACSYPEPNHRSIDAGPTVEIDAGNPGPDAGDDIVTLAVTHVGSGTVISEPTGIACDPDCTATFPAGTSITLRATAAQGNQLGGWAGCSGQLSCTFVLVTSTSITATFEPLVSPPPRGSHGMVWDPIRKRAIMFGGTGTNGPRRDIWEWDGNRWTDRTKTSGGPSGRNDFAMAFDANRNRVVVFGGLVGSAYNADTWEWDPNTGDWTDKTTAGPSARAYAHMVYDTARQRSVLFSGYNSTVGHIGDIWEWNGAAWTNRTTSPAPVARALGSMTFDSTRNRSLLFGGYGGGNRNDTWEWDGIGWVDRTPGSVKPSVRNTFQIVYDPVRQVTLLYGGFPPSPPPVYADTWLWNGAMQTWTNLSPSLNPGPLVGHAMTFDTERGRVILFGGGNGSAQSPTLSSETWEWNGTRWNKR